MMNRILFKTITVAALSLLSITGITPPTSAEDRDLYQELIELYPEMKQASREFLIDAFAKQAEKFGYAPDEYLEQIIEETRLNDEAMHQSIDGQAPSDSGGIQTRAAYPKLPDSYYKGDIYISPATHIFNHGHTGIYGDTYWVVEASGPGTLSNWHYTNEIAGPSGTKLFETTLSQHAQNLAADYAYTNLRGYRYPSLKLLDTVPNMVSPRDTNPNSLTCSQLVWLAYLRTTGVDLDGGELPPGLILPYDIENSPYTKKNWEVR
ncbi:hypothetical protein [Schaalia sp.]|uniref:hypothetical protein n=1 Tax=Schaalia sp. TaxID=2691890 RepID=UPI003D0CF248